MTISDKPEVIYALAGRCPIAASVLSDLEGKRIALLYLDRQHTEQEIFSLASAGLNQMVGLVGMNGGGVLESVSRPAFIQAVQHAEKLFAEAIEKARREISELEKLAELQDPRQA